jgi:uncharacterized integral membrane protein
MRGKLILGITLLILVVVFTLQNTSTVEIRFLAWQFTLSRALLLFLVLAIGIIIGWAVSAVSEREKHRTYKERIAAAEATSTPYDGQGDETAQ